ncbi:hypothetical protein PR202_ga16062 [Eleusine coracana subsp. coracana]|uniref:non-specific serine/threonine protein kinase n=1 Tax=Eleusine coracana subsp. coracana TaxID=191504 RepID=A0AAV5CLI3_ELECO|nr:hypothetical protein PR202_ga16062 [Eleusine coracana subsp. coracana]
MASSVMLVLLVLLASAVHVVGQPGFLSIDCGLDDKYSGYKDPDTGIFYVSDGAYTDAGQNLMVSPEYRSQVSRPQVTVRSFPSGVRNCYALPTETGAKYLVRLQANYGNHDGKNDNSSLEFDLYLGPNYWDTVYARTNVAYETVFLAWAGWAPACLVNTGRGTPYVSLLELRKLPGELYPPVTASQALAMYTRINMGAGTFTRIPVFFCCPGQRFPSDQFDRYWWASVGPQWRNLSSSSTIQLDPSFLVPSSVLQTAVTVAGNETGLTVMTWEESKTLYTFMVILHFADFQSSQPREFDIFFNGNQLGPGGRPYSPPALVSSWVYSSPWYRADDGNYNVTLVATATSALPPMLNALEIYTLVPQDSPTTFSKDFDAIMSIKLEYGVKKNWMGDPCFPSKYAWDGVKCSNTSDNVVRITSIDLSKCNLHGVISKNFTLLTALENLDLSYNNLSGSIPDSLTSLSSLQVLFIGQGGFGPVYYGRLEDNIEVAVKTRSESSSSHGLDQFLAEVESLTKVHHRNIVSLIGYCWEKDHLALVYEYMSQGSLFDHLRGKNAVGGTLNWKTRVRIVLEAAQGLDYLHKGCSPPIIHRDVKSGNILLGRNLHAKIADLGLSKTYLDDTQSHMSVTAAGTAGYMDPQYYLTGRLTESSDMYSFGIVLLEVATGEPPMVPGYGHIVQRVRQMIATGDISSVADARLGGAYDINSMWKLVDTAMLCTAESPAQRPGMAAVVAQLKESLTLEEAREKDTSTSVSRGSDIPPMASTFRPMAR